MHLREKMSAKASVLLERAWALEAQPWVQILLLDTYRS